MLTDEMRADGWIEHDGGPCPVDGGWPVLVMIRCGIIGQAWPDADAWQHKVLSRDPFGCTVEMRPTDIIAYKPETDHAG